jgi:hypothetical protein
MYGRWKGRRRKMLFLFHAKGLAMTEEKMTDALSLSLSGRKKEENKKMMLDAIEEQLNRESDPGYAVVTPLARSALARRKG